MTRATDLLESGPPSWKAQVALAKAPELEPHRYHRACLCLACSHVRSYMRQLESPGAARRVS